MTAGARTAPALRMLDGPPRLGPRYARILAELPLRRLGTGQLGMGRVGAARLGAGRLGAGTPRLPDTALGVAQLTVDRDRLAGYQRVCGFAVSDRLPPTYPFVLAFPLQVTLLTEPSFPYALPGLVHARNAIRQLRPIAAGEPLDLTVRAEGLAAHRRGATFDVLTTVAADGEPVWECRSTYLSRGGRAPQDSGRETGDAASATEPADSEGDPDGARPVAKWRVPGDIGRRYAAVSGDLNPMHLSRVAARLLGFPGVIAHGMWTKARVLGALESRLPDALVADVAFRRPLVLPATVRLVTAGAAGDWQVAVLADRSDRAHLRGTVRALDAGAG
jgi:acyl dehydratase